MAGRTRRTSPGRRIRGKVTRAVNRVRKACGAAVLAATCFAAGTQFTGSSGDILNAAIQAGLSAASRIVQIPTLDASALPAPMRRGPEDVEPGELAGKVVKVADGDTVTVAANGRTYRVRFLGIDAPEHDQAGGQASKMALLTLAMGKSVTVKWMTTDRYGRIVGKVLVSGKDANLAQIRAGHAWFYRNYAKSMFPEDREPYAAAEREAREKRLGLWRDANPTPPWEWRRAQREAENSGSSFSDFRDRSSAKQPEKSFWKKTKERIF